MNPALHRLCTLITALAQEHRLGTVGLVGAHANGTAEAHDATELFITVQFEKAAAFAHALAEETERAVHLYDFQLVPWAHPLHLCVCWLNVVQLPMRECPRGAVTRWRMQRHGETLEAVVRLESLPHFRGVDTFIAQRTGEVMRVIAAPALGGFLIWPPPLTLRGRRVAPHFPQFSARRSEPLDAHSNVPHGARPAAYPDARGMPRGAGIR
jgi:hypothetical protein